MKNFEKYKTVDDRVKGFNAFCDKHKRCKGCPFESVKHGLYCEFAWLELEAEEEKPMPCPFCGDKGEVNLIKINSPRENFVRCARCFYSSPHCDNANDAVAAHNRVARAVMAAKESEVHDE